MVMLKSDVWDLTHFFTSCKNSEFILEWSENMFFF